MNKSKLLLISALALGAMSCANDGASSSKPDAGASAAAADGTTLNIRYVVMDSISKNYVLAQSVAARAQELATSLQNEQIRLENLLQQEQNKLQQDVQNNVIRTEDAYNSALRDLQRKSNNYQSILAKKDQESGNEINRLQIELRDSIKNFIEAYNAVHHYDAILDYSAGLYFNPALDITNEVVEGLNARYSGLSGVDKEK